MDTLFDDTAIDQFVNTHTDGSFCHIENNSGSSMVPLVRHTLVDGWIGKDINMISNLDTHQVLREMNGSMVPELLGKHVARTRSGTK
jgi:hypothetical protein